MNEILGRFLWRLSVGGFEQLQVRPSNSPVRAENGNNRFFIVHNRLIMTLENLSTTFTAHFICTYIFVHFSISFVCFLFIHLLHRAYAISK